MDPIQKAMFDAEQIFKNSAPEIDQPECAHEFDDDICLMCGQIICHVFYKAVTSSSVLVKNEPYYLSSNLDRELVRRAVDMFGYLNTAQIRAAKKKIILTTCLLYVCVEENNIVYFYENFSEMDVTAKDMIYGIAAVEELLPADKNINLLDFKLHELLLLLVMRGPKTYLKQFIALHPGLYKCYNTLRIKSILEACFFLFDPVGKQPTAVERVRESIFLYRLPALFSEIFIQTPTNNHTRSVSSIEGTYVRVKLDPLKLISKRTDQEIDYTLGTLAAWQFLFSDTFYHPNGYCYTSKVSLENMLDSFVL